MYFWYPYPPPHYDLFITKHRLSCNTKNVLFSESSLSKNYLENNRKSSFFTFPVPNIWRRLPKLTVFNIMLHTRIICIKTGWFLHYDFRIKNTTWQIYTLNKLLFLTKDVVHWVLTEYYVLVHAAFKINVEIIHETPTA